MYARTCKCCGLDKPLDEMVPLKRRGKTYYRSLCRKCDNAQKLVYRTSPVGRSQQCAWRAARRKNKQFWAVCIREDLRAEDKKRGRANDLSRQIISDLIKDGCQYCGEVDIRMTLDRIDNTKGHTVDNVVAACLRCNDVRGNMPYQAWLMLVPAMRATRESGIFGTWVGRHHPSTSETEQLSFAHVAKGQDKSKDIKHGTSSAYNYRKCRCAECKAYKARENKKRGSFTR